MNDYDRPITDQDRAEQYRLYIRFTLEKVDNLDILSKIYTVVRELAMNESKVNEYE